MENLEIKTPVKLVSEDGKLVVRVTGKNDTMFGLKMGTDFESSDIQAVMGFAEEVYEIGYSDGNSLQFQSKERKFIAVIAKNVDDFLEWKKENKHIPTSKDKNTVKRYTIGDTTYIRIVKPHDCISCALNEIKETSSAHLNPNYHKILEYVKPCLKISNKI